MLDSPEELEKSHANSADLLTEGSNHVILDMPNEARLPEMSNLESQSKSRKRLLMWWIKVAILCLVIIGILAIFLKWGAPFLIEKVFQPLCFCQYLKFCAVPVANPYIGKDTFWLISNNLENGFEMLGDCIEELKNSKSI